ncbi:hypothetical protein J6590_063691, partial [Homalodisca vitripennis]
MIGDVLTRSKRGINEPACEAAPPGALGAAVSGVVGRRLPASAVPGRECSVSCRRQRQCEPLYIATPRRLTPPPPPPYAVTPPRTSVMVDSVLQTSRWLDLSRWWARGRLNRYNKFYVTMSD